MTSSQKPRLSSGAAEWLTSFADDEHIVGARHANWIGLGPFLEEDLAFCSIAQDELGHAVALYELLTDDVDKFALMREPSAYRSCWLAELPCLRWDDALVRHWLYDEAELLRWQAMADSSRQDLCDIAARSLSEEAFHRQHSRMYLERLTSTASEGRSRIIASIEQVLPIALGLWEPVAGEQEALAQGLTSRASSEMGAEWATGVQAALAAWGVEVAWPSVGPAQRARSERHASFGELHHDLQAVMVIDPDADW